MNNSNDPRDYTLTVGGGTLTVVGTITTGGTGGTKLFTVSTGTINFTKTGSWTWTTDLDINVTGSGSVIFTGDITSGDGIFTLSGTDCLLRFLGTYTASNGNGDISLTAAGTITFDGLVTHSAGNIENITTAGIINFNGGYTFSSGSGTYDRVASSVTNIKKDLTVNAAMTFTTGSVKLVSTAEAQTLGGTTAPTFYDFTINNTYGTSPQITLAVNMTVKNTLTMTAGKVNLAGYTFTIGTASATPGTISYTAGLMYGGTIKRWLAITSTIADGNTTAGLFPIGVSAGGYRPFYISCPTTGPTTGGTLSISYTNAITASDVSFADGGSTVIRRHNAYWTGSTTTLAGGTYNVRIEAVGLGTITDVTHLRLTQSGSVVGTAGTNATPTSNPQVNRTGLTLANLTNSFYVGSVDAASTLPVELLSFSAVKEEDYITLNWSTASEINSDYYEIMRSADGENFESIGSQSAAGSSNKVLSYDMIDSAPLQGTNYYQLVEYDKDGHQQKSKIVAINYTSDHDVITQLYPNPSTDKTTLYFNSNTGGLYKLQIIDLNGNALYFAHIPAMIGENKFSISTDAYEPGTYFIKLTDPSDKFSSLKFVKQ